MTSPIRRAAGREATATWLPGFVLVAVTAFHLISAISHWPFPTQLARYAIPHESRPRLLAALAVLLFFQSLALPFRTWVVTPASSLRRLASVTLWLVAAALLYKFRWGPFVGPPILIAGFLLLAINVLVFYLRRNSQAGAPGGEAADVRVSRLSPSRAVMLFLLVFNLALLALPRLSFITSPPPISLPHLTKQSLHFGYMDVAVSEGNPLFYIGRAASRVFGRIYLANHLYTLSLNVLAAVLFSIAVSQLWGYDLAVLTCAVSVTDLWFIKVAYVGNNAGTLLLPCAIAILCLTSVLSVQVSTRTRRIAVGLQAGSFIAVLLCLMPYAYAPMRLAGGLVVLLAVGWAAFRLRRSTRSEVLRFAAFLALPSLLPAALLLWSYDWSIGGAARDFKATAYNPPAQKVKAKPEGVSIAATMSPDLPIWVGFRPGASGVCWTRSPLELGKAIGIHWRNAWRASRGQFPGAPYAEILFLAGLYLFLQAQIGPAWRFLLVSYMFLALVSPYLLVASPNEFRRGAAVILPLSLGIAAALLLTAKWALGVWISNARIRRYLAVMTSLLGIVLLRYPLELTQLAREGCDIGITLRCTEFPIRGLLLSPAIQRIGDGDVMFVRRGDGRCMEAALATVEVRKHLANSTVVELRSEEELDRAIGRLGPRQWLVLDCGVSARREARQDELCRADAVVRRTALSVATSPQESDTVWTIVK